WLAAMNETTVFFFNVLTLTFWARKQYTRAGITYLLALFSKESAIIIPLLILALDVYQHKRVQWGRYWLLAFPTAVFTATFLFTVSHNFMLTSRSYSPGPQAVIVLVKSIHRLLWPWFYIMVVIVWFKTRQLPPLTRIAAYLGGVILAMLPYMFIAY